jgi:GDP-L-fucose synthase
VNRGKLILLKKNNIKMKKNSIIFLAGHNGLVGSAIKKNLDARGYTNIITRTHSELDLTNQQAVEQFFKKEKPEYVFLAAAKVGGIVANNTYRGEFIYENMMIQNNVIHHSYLNGVKKLLFLGSTCIYPKNAAQPMKEEYLLTDTLEYTNEPYAIAKIAGIKMCESYNIQYNTNFIAVQPTNLYGPNDNFDLEKSHVLPALIRKIHLGKALENKDWETIKKDLNRLPIEGITGKSSNEEILNILNNYGVRLCKQSEAISSSKIKENLKTSHLLGGDVRRTEGVEGVEGVDVEVEIWGSGKPLREFLWSEDMADACVHIMEHVDFDNLVFPNKPDHREGAVKEPHEITNTHVNIGTGKEISIKQLAETIKKTIGFQGDLYFNTSKPDGTMRKLTDSSKLKKLGWKYTVELEEGIKRMYEWYLEKEV